MKHYGLGQKVAYFFQFWKKLNLFCLTGLIAYVKIDGSVLERKKI